MSSVYEDLKREITYVLNGSNIFCAHEIYGKIIMARKLEAISENEYKELTYSIFDDFIARPEKWQCR